MNFFFNFGRWLTIKKYDGPHKVVDKDRFGQVLVYNEIARLTDTIYAIRAKEDKEGDKPLYYRYHLVKKLPEPPNSYMCECCVTKPTREQLSQCYYNYMARTFIHQMDEDQLLANGILSNKAKTIFRLKGKKKMFFLYVEWNRIAEVPIKYVITIGMRGNYKCNCTEVDCEHIALAYELVGKTVGTPKTTQSRPRLRTTRQGKADESIQDETDQASNEVQEEKQDHTTDTNASKEKKECAHSTKNIVLLFDMERRLKYSKMLLNADCFRKKIFIPERNDERCEVHGNEYELHCTHSNQTRLVTESITITGIKVYHLRTKRDKKNKENDCGCVIYYDGYKDAIFNYNDKNMFTHGRLLQWLVSFQWVPSTMFSFSQIQNFVGLLWSNSEEVDKATCQQAFKEFLRLIRFDDSEVRMLFSCDKCSKAEKLLLAMDGIQLGCLR